MNVPRESEIRPEFRAHLEWQIASALRREERFAAPVGGGLTRLRTAVAMMAALAVGAATMAASGELQEARQRDALIEAAKSEEALMQLRIELAKAAYEDARRRFEVGTASRETVRSAEAELRAMEMRLARNRLDIEEITATAMAPRNDLQAPLVGGRDFVSERLKLDLKTAQQAMAGAEQTLQEARKRFEVGLASRAALLQGEMDLAHARMRMEELRATIDLRGRALAGDIKVEDLVSSVRRVKLTMEQQRIQREIEFATARVEELRRLVSVGQATDLDLKRAEIEVLQRQIDLKLIRQEIEKAGAIRR